MKRTFTITTETEREFSTMMLALASHQRDSIQQAQDLAGIAQELKTYGGATEEKIGDMLITVSRIYADSEFLLRTISSLGKQHDEQEERMHGTEDEEN